MWLEQAIDQPWKMKDMNPDSQCYVPVVNAVIVNSFFSPRTWELTKQTIKIEAFCQKVGWLTYYGGDFS